MRLATILFLAAGILRAEDPPLSKDDADFFQQKVQPILQKRCYDCHSHEAKKIKGGLTLDSRDGWSKGGDTGPAIDLKKPGESLLLRSVHFNDPDFAMPPKEKLPDAEIAVFDEWVKRGAPDPRITAAGVGATDEIWQKARTHWAFKPIGNPAPPDVKDKTWPRTPVDAFILAKLEAKGLKPAPPADKATLCRRIFFDLIGLPPTPAELNTFLADKSPDAYAKLVDRLLASPRYGERWARHWLDVARYAETTGEAVLQGKDNRYLYAYTYRDYVIRAFNEDKPYDQFLIEQLAADKLPLGEDKHPLAALGFITVGKRFLNSPDDLIDDRIDVVSRGLLGLTVACARCHDHKFDPIPTKDYYSLHGVFASSVEPDDEPVIERPKDQAATADYEKQRAVALAEVEDYEADEWNRVLGESWQKFPELLLAIHAVRNKQTDGSSPAIFYRQKGLGTGIPRTWENAFRIMNRKPHPVLGPWLAFSALPEKDFATEAPKLAAKFASNDDPQSPLNPLVAQLFSGEAPKSIGEVAQRYGKLIAKINDAYQAARKQAQTAANRKAVEVPPLADAHQQEIRGLLLSDDAPANPSRLAFRTDVGLRSSAVLNKLQSKVNDLDLTHPGSPARAMVLQDVEKPRDSFVFIRGDKTKRGPVVPRQFVEILAGGERKPFTDGSGRLDLAKAIASKENPLTARVLVNRIWLDHFGQGLVGTPSDFGLRGEAPTHPELLDYLARRFMDDGWSIKKLHRLIVLSDTYQQRSDDSPRATELDPGNTLLSHFNRRRLDFEATRDTLLATSGSLSPDIGGRSVSVATDATRRTLYASIDRLNLPGVFTTFDFASPDMTSPQRNETTVPTQALFLMNSPFVIEQAKLLVARPEIAQPTTDDQRIRRLYQILFQRQPTAQDLGDGLEFLRLQTASKPALPPKSDWNYGVGRLAEATKEVKFFEAKRFATDAWQIGGKTGAVTLTEAGGAAQPQPQGPTRRWTSPVDATVRIDAVLGHIAAPKKSGVRGWVVLSRAGEPAKLLGKWDARGAKKPTKLESVEVKQGDTIDFIVLTLGEEPETFAWAPLIELCDPAGHAKHRWSAQTEFAGPPEPAPLGLTPLEKYAQVLLLTNELVFVN